MMPQEQAHLYKLVHWNPNSFQRSVFCLFQTSHGCCRRNRLLHVRREIDPCFQAIFLCLEYSVVGKYLFNRKLHQFLMLHFFFRLRNQRKTWPCLKFSLTFADWSWIVPGTIITRDGSGTNPCIAMSAKKPHRSPMSEAFSWSSAMSWWGEFDTRCYGIQQAKSNQHW